MIQKSAGLASWLAWSGIFLIIFGVCSFAGNTAWYKTRNWVPLDVPITLSTGYFTSSDFTVSVKEAYTIQLEVDREVPKQLTDTVLGTGDPSSNRNALRGFNLAWTLSSDGRILKHDVSDGRDQGYWGARRMGRNLGCFRAEKGKQYRLDVNAVEDGSQLASYHPRLKVGVDLLVLDGLAIKEGILELTSLGVAGMGAVLFIPAVFLKRRWRLARRSTLPAL